MSADRELARLEARLLAADTVAQWLAVVALIREALAGDGEGIAELIERATPPDIERALTAAGRDAFDIGLADGVGIAELAGATVPAVSPIVPAALVAGIVVGLDFAGRGAYGAARALQTSGAEPRIFAAPILGHARRVRSVAADVLTQAAAVGEQEAARAAGLKLVWVAETNACVHCLAYSGVTVDVDEDFPDGLTYARTTPHTPGRTPPLHPHCRCELEPLRSQEYADALRREADRSVLRGFSLESESMAQRVEAAKLLLERGVTAPKTVIEFAERRVAEGRFVTRGRP